MTPRQFQSYGFFHRILSARNVFLWLVLIKSLFFLRGPGQIAPHWVNLWLPSFRESHGFELFPPEFQRHLCSNTCHTGSCWVVLWHPTKVVDHREGVAFVVTVTNKGLNQYMFIEENVLHITIVNCSHWNHIYMCQIPVRYYERSAYLSVIQKKVLFWRISPFLRILILSLLQNINSEVIAIFEDKRKF